MNGLYASPCRGRQRAACAPVCRPAACISDGSPVLGLTAALMSWNACCGCSGPPCGQGTPTQSHRRPQPDCRPEIPPCPPPRPACCTRSLRSLLDMPNGYCLLQAEIVPCRCMCRNGQVSVEYEIRVRYRDACCKEKQICCRKTACFDGISLPPGRLTVAADGCPRALQGRCHLSLEQKIKICSENRCGA
ncbi:MAG: hypothetical protein K6B40_04425 [Firmicutes bacterium]|nr:hypothetical protein [Bacillota bacterium]